MYELDITKEKDWMMLKWIKIFPYFLEYIDMPEEKGGYVSGLTVYIRPKYKDDIGIHKHEECHILQRYMTLGFHNVIKSLSEKYSQWVEISSYREQLKWPPATTAVAYYRKVYAGFIATRYGLDITNDEAYKRLGG